MVLSFLDVELDLDRYELRRGGVPVSVEPQVFDVLAHLGGNPGRLISKEELLDAVWGDRFVSESALTSRIKAARRAVGDDGTRQAVIATVHGRGYRLMAAVHDLGHAFVDPTALSAGLPLLERENALRELGAALAAAWSGSGRFVCVSGEAGMGKSTLVHEFARRVGPDSTVLIAACDDLTTPRALGPFHDLAAQLAGPVRALIGGEMHVDGLLHAWQTVASDRGCVVVIEDLHWADDATLDLVRQLARRIRSAPVVLVVTYREEDVALDHPLRRLIGTARGPHVSHLVVPPLSAAAVGRLVESSTLDASEVFEATGGNPLFVSELVAAPPGALPPTVKDAVVARLARLTTQEIDAVRALSVMPARVDRGLAEGLVGSCAARLAAAERIGLLAGDAGHVWFRHELVRRAVEDTLVSSERVRLHRTVAWILHRQGADPARVTHHAARAQDVELLLAAGPAAARAASLAGAQRQVVEHLAAVLRHRQRLSDSEQADLLTRRAHALYLLNRFTESLVAADEAVGAARKAGIPDLLASALLAQGRTALWAVGPQAARHAVEEALDVLGPDGDMELRCTAHADFARAVGELVTVGSVPQGSPLALHHATEALRLADRLDRADLQGYALVYLGSERLADGDESGLADLRQALDLLSGFPRTDIAVRACVNLSGACFRAGRFDEVERYVQLGVDLAKRTEFMSAVYRLSLTRSSARLSCGRWREAEDELRSLLAFEGEPGIMKPLARALLARLLARQGGVIEARAVLQPALVAAETSAEARLLGPVAVALVEVDWLGGGAATDNGDIPARALNAVVQHGYPAVAAELGRFLGWAGRPIPNLPEVLDFTDAPEPWRSGLRGDWRAASRYWDRRGEPYERALELLSGDDRVGFTQGIVLLENLGATATIAAVRPPPR